MTSRSLACAKVNLSGVKTGTTSFAYGTSTRPSSPSSIGNPPDPTAALLARVPIAPNENILQYQNTGHLAGNVFSFISSSTVQTLRPSQAHDTPHESSRSDWPHGVRPQSSYSNAGESARVDWLRRKVCILFGNVICPGRSNSPPSSTPTGRPLQHHHRYRQQRRRRLQRQTRLRFSHGIRCLQHALWPAHCQHGEWQCCPQSRNHARHHRTWI